MTLSSIRTKHWTRAEYERLALPRRAIPVSDFLL
jgi:hypothetical protein